MTRKQSDFDDRVLDAIAAGLHANGYAPTIRELRDSCGVNSTSVIHHALDRLVQAGRVTHESGKARTLRLVETVPTVSAGPANVCPACYSQRVDFGRETFMCQVCGATWPQRSESHV